MYFVSQTKMLKILKHIINKQNFEIYNSKIFDKTVLTPLMFKILKH